MFTVDSKWSPCCCGASILVLKMRYYSHFKMRKLSIGEANRLIYRGCRIWKLNLNSEPIYALSALPSYLLESGWILQATFSFPFQAAFTRIIFHASPACLSLLSCAEEELEGAKFIHLIIIEFFLCVIHCARLWELRNKNKYAFWAHGAFWSFCGLDFSYSKPLLSIFVEPGIGVSAVSIIKSERF